MKTDHLGQMIFAEDDLFDYVMQGKDLHNLHQIIVDETVNIAGITAASETVPDFIEYNKGFQSISQEDFDQANQSLWFMPEEYKNLDIAAYVLGLCSTQEQLQRVGHELLIYQEKNLFDLLRYLKYLVDVMKANHIIWGVGRGSSVASYVLYLLGVHRIDSLYYDLDPGEFLR